jgi:hypothetical protein
MGFSEGYVSRVKGLPFERVEVRCFASFRSISTRTDARNPNLSGYCFLDTSIQDARHHLVVSTSSSNARGLQLSLPPSAF